MKTKTNAKKAPKCACKCSGKKPCKCGSPKVEKLGEQETKAALARFADSTKASIDRLSDLSAKAGEVLKYLLEQLKACRNDLEFLQKAKAVGAVKCHGADAAAEYVENLLKDDFKELCEEKPSTGDPLVQSPGDLLVQCLFKESKYDIGPGEMDARRRPDLDTDSSIGYEFTAHAKAVRTDGFTESCDESFTCNLCPDKDESVRRFDACVGRMVAIRFLEKKPKQKLNGVDMSSLPEVAGLTCHKPVKKPSSKPGKAKIVPVLGDLKKTVLECSKYAVPSSRVKFVYDHEDKKHRNHVYEVRFFQKSYKSVPAETQSYERAELNVRSNGDRDDLIAKRFDAVVAGLRFNSFPEKK